MSLGFYPELLCGTLWILDKWFNHMITWRWWGERDLQIYHVCLFLVPFYVCDVKEEWGEMRRYEHVVVSTRMFLHAHIHVWLGNLSVSLPELQHKMNSHWLEATGASGRAGPTHLDFLLACVLETVLWEAVPSKSWTPSVQLLNPWSQDISGIHQVMVPVSSEHWAELQPWEWMPDLMGGSL